MKECRILVWVGEVQNVKRLPRYLPRQPGDSDLIHIYMPPVVTRGGRSVGGIVTFRQLVVLLKFSPPTWLTECFSADHCLSSLLDDYQSAGSIFRGSELFVLF